MVQKNLKITETMAINNKKFSLPYLNQFKPYLIEDTQKDSEENKILDSDELYYMFSTFWNWLFTTVKCDVTNQ